MKKMLTTYRVLYRIALAALVMAAIFHSKIRTGLLGRIGLRRRLRTQCQGWENSVWFHVSSAGELEQCLSVLEHLKRLAPQRRILLTYFSPSARWAIWREQERRAQAGLSLPWDYADYSPFDLAGHIETVLDTVRPRLFVSVHREIWPEILERCHQRGIPCTLIAVYVSHSVRRRFHLYRPWMRYWSHVSVVESSSADFLTQLGLEKVSVEGDPRIDRIVQRQKSNEGGIPRFLIFASLWPEDYAQLKSVWSWIVENSPQSRFLIVPHEPAARFCGQMEDFFARRGLPVQRWSLSDRSFHPEFHWIVDTVGLLADLYRRAEIVFVGGSFRRRVHNVLEPAIWGKPILTGPKITNSAEAVEMARDKSGLLSARNSKELKDLYQFLIQHPDERQRLGELSRGFVLARQGASERCARLLLSSI